MSSPFTDFVDDCCVVKHGDLQDVPAPEDGVKHIVSAMVLAASDRADLVAPATGHPACARDNGRIVSVPGFVGKQEPYFTTGADKGDALTEVRAWAQCSPMQVDD